MTTDEKLVKAMDLLHRVIEHLPDYASPDVDWWADVFALTGEHMILTDEGWESGSSKQTYIDDWQANYSDMPNPILDEVNAPV